MKKWIGSGHLITDGNIKNNLKLKSMEEKQGIEQIKKTLEFAFDLAVQVMDILKDKK